MPPELVPPELVPPELELPFPAVPKLDPMTPEGDWTKPPPVEVDFALPLVEVPRVEPPRVPKFA